MNCIRAMSGTEFLTLTPYDNNDLINITIEWYQTIINFLNRRQKHSSTVALKFQTKPKFKL